MFVACKGPERLHRRREIGRTSAWNEQNIYTNVINVRTAGRNVCPKLSGLAAGKKSVFASGTWR